MADDGSAEMKGEMSRCDVTRRVLRVTLRKRPNPNRPATVMSLCWDSGLRELYLGPLLLKE